MREERFYIKDLQPIREFCINSDKEDVYEYIYSLQQENEKLAEENFNLREGIMLEKMAIPKEKADIRNFYEIFEVPSYNQLEQALLDIKEYVEYYTNEYPESKVTEFDIMANPCHILDIINKVIKKYK